MHSFVTTWKIESVHSYAMVKWRLIFLRFVRRSLSEIETENLILLVLVTSERLNSFWWKLSISWRFVWAKMAWIKPPPVVDKLIGSITLIRISCHRLNVNGLSNFVVLSKTIHYVGFIWNTQIARNLLKHKKILPKAENKKKK